MNGFSWGCAVMLLFKGLSQGYWMLKGTVWVYASYLYKFTVMLTDQASSARAMRDSVLAQYVPREAQGVFAPVICLLTCICVSGAWTGKLSRPHWRECIALTCKQIRRRRSARCARAAPR